MRPVLALLAAATGAVLLSGCGFEISQDDDVEPDAGTVRAGLAALWSGPDASPELTAEGECFADALTGRMSLDELVSAGVVGDDGTVGPDVPMLDVDTAGAWVDAAAACTPYAEIAGRTLAARFEGRLDADAYAACLDASVPADRLREALVASLSGGYATDPAAADLQAAVTPCAQGALRTG